MAQEMSSATAHAPDPTATQGTTSERTFASFDDAAREAARIGCNDGLVAKVQRSPYGPGFIVRTVPVEFLLQPELKQRFVRPLEYRQL